jgi:hypothetical protein
MRTTTVGDLLAEEAENDSVGCSVRADGTAEALMVSAT